jgi:hypothetical protein
MKRKGGNQIENLTFDHKSFEIKRQMRYHQNMLYTVGKIFSKDIGYFPRNFKKKDLI